MKFRLVENWLVESIDSSYEYYKSKIEREDFDRLIRLDPTFKENVNKLGNYGKWILNNYLKPESDVKSNEGHIKDCLIRFEENKKNLINSDIMKFKSLSEIDDYLNDEQSYKEQSHRQEVRQRQKDRKNADLNTEAELIYEDSDWEVWVPKTYAASCKLGQGAKWGTATTESDYYYNYYKDQYGGDYYININKHNPNEKYQFHFESDQFMNINDVPIDLQNFFDENAQLYKLYSKKFNLKGFDVWPKEERDEILKNGFIYKNDCEQVPLWVTKIIVDDDVKALPAFCFAYCNLLTTIDLKNITKLPDYCFGNCTSLTTIDLKNVTTLFDFCFDGCKFLKSIDLKNVTEVGDYCFDYCDSLTTIDLKNVTKLGKKCLSYCNSLKEIICHNENQVQMCKEKGLEDKTTLKESLRGNKMKFKLVEDFYFDNNILPEYKGKISDKLNTLLKDVAKKHSKANIYLDSFGANTNLYKLTITDKDNRVTYWESEELSEDEILSENVQRIIEKYCIEAEREY